MVRRPVSPSVVASKRKFERIGMVVLRSTTDWAAVSSRRSSARETVSLQVAGGHGGVCSRISVLLEVRSGCAHGQGLHSRALRKGWCGADADEIGPAGNCTREDAFFARARVSAHGPILAANRAEGCDWFLCGNRVWYPWVAGRLDEPMRRTDLSRVRLLLLDKGKRIESTRSLNRLRLKCGFMLQVVVRTRVRVCPRFRKSSLKKWMDGKTG